jgi:ribosome-binding protein aMBF1 (putative translation factor)
MIVEKFIMPRRKDSDAIRILHRRYYRNNPERLASLDAERQNAAIARTLFQLRSKSGLTQGDLAARVGTTTSVISRLESADYEGHSLTMLRRVAAALGRDVEVRFVTPKKAAG